MQTLLGNRYRHVPQIPRGHVVMRAPASFQEISGTELKAMREAYGLSMAELALALGVSKSSIYNWERRPQLPSRVCDIISYFRESMISAEKYVQHSRGIPTYSHGYRVLPTGHVLPERWWRGMVSRATHQ